MNSKRRTVVGAILVAAVMSLLAGLTPAQVPVQQDPTPVYGFKIINSYLHDHNAFTQGLLYDNGVFYESTGLNGRSSVRKVELETGRGVANH